MGTWLHYSKSKSGFVNDTVNLYLLHWGWEKIQMLSKTNSFSKSIYLF